MGISSGRRLGDRTIKILALDLGGRSGYAALFGHGLIKVGTLKLDRGDACRESRSPLPMVRLWKRLNKLSEGPYKIECVIFEEAFARGGAKYRLDSMQFIITLWAIVNGITWARVGPTQWKKQIVGKGTAAKAEYHAFAKEKWPEHPLIYDDEAAARCVLEYAMQFYERQERS